LSGPINPVRAIDAYVETLNLAELGCYFNGNVSDECFHSVKRLAEDIEKLGGRIDEWLSALDQADRDDLESPSRDPDLPAKLEKLKGLRSLKESKEELLNSLTAAGVTQIS